MRPFSNHMKSDGTVTHLPLNPGLSPASGPTVAYPAVSAGTVVRASVQPRQVLLSIEDGVRRYSTEYVVTLLDDPSTLNGGIGCRRDDAFHWTENSGRYLVAIGDPDRLRTAWRVRCIAYE